MKILLIPRRHVITSRTLLLLIFCLWAPIQVVGQAKNATVSTPAPIGRTGNATVSSSRPRVVNIGALFTYNSAIGRSAKPAILAAVDDVNKDSSILKGTKLNVIFHDTNCSAFVGTVECNSLNSSKDFCPLSSLFCCRIWNLVTSFLLMLQRVLLDVLCTERELIFKSYFVNLPHIPSLSYSILPHVYKSPYKLYNIILWCIALSLLKTQSLYCFYIYCLQC